ncbi:MAG: hypothetical protein R3C13_05515 [Hyphomonas sp.]
MTTALLLLAALCLVFSAFCMFGLPYIVMGPRVFDQLRARASHKVWAGSLLAAAISLVWVLQASPSLISPVSGVQVIADDMTGGWQI